MLTEMHIAVIGGDAKRLEVIRKLVELDAKLSLIGFDQLDHTEKRKYTKFRFHFCRRNYFAGCRYKCQRRSRYYFSNEKFQ